MMDDNHRKFINGILGQARYIAHSPQKMDTHGTLFDLFSYPHLTSLVLTYRTSVKDALRLLWGFGFTMAQDILIAPDPTPQQLEILTDLLHDHVPYTIDIQPVLEAVSYALGNDTLFGEEFTDSQLRDAAEIPF